MDPGIRSTEQLKAYHPSQNERERLVAEHFKEAGWYVHRHGWPDFLMVRDDEIKVIEVKNPTDRITPGQRRMHRALRKAGIEVIVVRVDGDRLIEWNGSRKNVRHVPWSRLTG